MDNEIYNEIYKAALKYHIKQIVREASFFTLILVFIYINIFSYSPGWFWLAKSCFFVVWLCLCGKAYKKFKRELDEMMDKALEYKFQVDDLITTVSGNLDDHNE